MGRERESEEVTVACFQLVGSIDYPRDEKGEIIGLLHPELQNGDFNELKHGDPTFLMHDGSVKTFDATQFKDEAGPLAAFFINEAAYYEKAIAFQVARKIERKVRMPKERGLAARRCFELAKCACNANEFNDAAPWHRCRVMQIAPLR